MPDWIGPNTAPWTMYYVNEKLFTPTGISWVNCLASNTDTAAHAYDRSDTAKGGALFQMSGTSFEACASYRGLHMSAGGYAHGGRYNDGGGHGKFAGDVEVAVVVNSRIGDANTHACAVVASAVKNAS